MQMTTGAVPRDRRCCWDGAQGHFLDDLAGLAVDDVERAVGLVADVDRVRRERSRRRGRLDALITCTTLFVAGSMTWTLSPALLVA